MPLKHYKEFQEVLEKYRVSDQAMKALEGLKFVLMIAPTSGGRNTIIRRQQETGRYHYIVSDTTRPPRVNDGVMEENGREYWFRTEDEMLADLKTGQYLEAEIIHGQQVSGISVRELQKAKSENKIAITDIDLEGTHNILKVKPDSFAVMVLPPNFDEWQRRLAGRGQMRPDEQQRRLETAANIFEDGLRQDYYHFVVSENVDQSAAIIDAIVEGQPNPHQGRGKGVIENLRHSLQQKLDNVF